MLLESINIVGFRGINRIYLPMDKSTLLIGENQWGKSSLLDAFTLLLSPDDTLYRFIASDFYCYPNELANKEQHLQVVFTFCETEEVTPHPALSPVWVKCDDRIQRIYYRIEGYKTPIAVQTRRTFLDAAGEPLKIDDVDTLALKINKLNPVLRLRDTRTLTQVDSNKLLSHLGHDETPIIKRIDEMMAHCSSLPLSDKELEMSVKGIRLLMENYFVSQTGIAKIQSTINNHPDGGYWQSIEGLNQVLERLDKTAQPMARRVRLILLGLFVAILQAKGSARLDAEARPLLLLEDPESRFHPIMLSVVWGLFEHLPLQKLTTTNSGELLSLVPIQSVCRMVRDSSRVATYRLAENGLNSIDNRRIAFHIRFNRASSLFARSWLLVEGETEVWLLNDLAKQCGYHFESEGIKIIEFAQCGLKPLLKFAHQMGIEWHVLVDGDEAGKKYANTARAFAGGKHQHERDRLTELPTLDLENFMYREGFAEVYQRVAAVSGNSNISVKKIIQKAIHRTSKPDLAIEVAEQAKIWGADSVPALLKKMFSKVVWKARGKSDAN